MSNTIAQYHIILLPLDHAAAAIPLAGPLMGAWGGSHHNPVSHDMIVLLLDRAGTRPCCPLLRFPAVVRSASLHVRELRAANVGIIWRLSPLPASTSEIKAQYFIT